MNLAQPIVFAYAGIYLLALVLAIWQRKKFPLGDALAVLIIVGFGFTALVYFVAPPAAGAPTQTTVQLPEMLFTIAYLILTAVLLVYRHTPVAWKGNFVKEKLYTLGYKVLLFVLAPLAALALIWGRSWTELGFSAGDILIQLRTSVILIIFLGGFNLLLGSGAAPIRARKFSARQVILGLGLTLVWNVIEVGLVEEFYFRVFIQGRFIGFLGSPVSGICLASLLFGLAHAPGIYLRGGDKVGPLGEHPTLLNAILYTILALSPAGWFTGLLFWRTQSLLAPILVHAAADAAANGAEFIEGLKLSK